MAKRGGALSLFSGAGGLDIAAHLAGFQTVAAVESVSRYAESLRLNAWLSGATRSEFDTWLSVELANMGKLDAADRTRLRDRLVPTVGKENAMSRCQIFATDITKLRSEDVAESVGIRRGDLDLIIGGPPCQSFSKAGQRKSVDDDRGQLFVDFARFVKDFRPRWFLFENVKGLAHSSAPAVLAVCKRCGEFMPSFEEVLALPDASNYVCPTCNSTSRVVQRSMSRRGALDVVTNEFERLGYQCTVLILNALSFGVPQSRERLFIVGSRDGERYVPPTPTHQKRESDKGDDQLSLVDVGPEYLPPETVWATLFSERNTRHNWPLDPDEAVLWVKNVVRPHDEPVTWDLRRPSPTVGAHQAAKLAIAPYGVPQAQLDRQQWHVRGRRQGDTPPVEVPHTYLSDEDLLTLQTFPKSWFVAGTRMERAFQIGNAVPPRLGAAVLAGINMAG